MAFKFIISGIAAVALSVTPTLAAAQTALPTTEVQPAAENAEGSELRRHGLLIPAAILIAIILAVILLAGDDEDSPASP